MKMDNSEIFALIQKMETEMNNKLDRIFELLGKHDDEVNNIKVKQGQMEIQIKMLEGKSGNTRANISIAIAIIMFLSWLITTVIGGMAK